MRVTLRARRSIWCSWRVSLVAPRIVNDLLYLMRINHEIYFAWQAQYLVKLECHFSWRAQQFVKFWEIAGARNVVSFHIKCASKMRRVRSPKMTILCSDHARIVFFLPGTIQGFFADILDSEFRGRRSIWCCSTVTSNAPRIINDVSYVRSYYHESAFA